MKVEEKFYKCWSQRRRGKKFFLSVGEIDRKEAENILSILPPWLLRKHSWQVGVKQRIHGNFEVE